jgi:sugar phosphate isomerase/epimerase
VRFRHPDGTAVHVAYGADVQPATDWEGILGYLRDYAEPVRERLGVDLLGLGMWLPADLVPALVEQPRLTDRLRAELRRRGLEVVTLNGVGYAAGPARATKRAAYDVDWSRPDRLAYTLDLARCLARLLPDDACHGSVSTLALAWRRPWFPDQEQAAFRHLDALSAGLRRIAAEEGRPVRVGLEPSPGCVLETTQDAARLLHAVDRDWIGTCLDACHLAVAFEEPHAAVARLVDGQLTIVKAQVSCALQVATPELASTRVALQAVTGTPYLHQVRERSRRGVRGVDDIGEALEGRYRLPARGPWRLHFHVPMHRAAAQPFTATSGAVSETLRALLGGPHARTDHIEVEMDSWTAATGLPEPSDRRLVPLVAAELDWLRARLSALGLAARAG